VFVCVRVCRCVCVCVCVCVGVGVGVFSRQSESEVIHIIGYLIRKNLLLKPAMSILLKTTLY
jgi:hypothetical protein